MANDVLLDVRSIHPRERHPKIFKAWETLPVGGTLQLVNDHDPKPLYYEFCAERKGEFEWKPVERGPERWSVEIRRIAVAAAEENDPALGLVNMDHTVKEVMERYPATQKVFAHYGLDMCCGGAHPIWMAADAHGADADRLLTDLNVAAGAAAKQAACRCRPAWAMEDARRLVDVREDLRRGQEPFQRIMSAAAGLAPGETLTVRAIFEPKPLYQVLGARGLEHWTERLAEDDWKVYFRREERNPGEDAGPNEAAPPPKPASAAFGAAASGKVHALDVCGLEPPEPMVRILSKLPELGPGDKLVVKHFREPVPLYAHLEEAGFDHSIEKLGEGLFRLTIWKRADAA